jgi:hypothetical protein
VPVVTADRWRIGGCATIDEARDEPFEMSPDHLDPTGRATMRPDEAGCAPMEPDEAG